MIHKPLLKEQRVGVFIDVQNLYYSAQAIYGKKVNFKNILEDIVAGRPLVRATAYAVKADATYEQTFFSALEGMGIEVKLKDLQIFYGGQKKADWDVGLAVDTIKQAPKLDTVIICSGDGDFGDVVQYLMFLGCRVEVAAFGKSTSGKLKDMVHKFWDLDQSASRYLLITPNRKPPTRPSHPTLLA
jgi:uncharacterized LabA/DUF88 family protein